jgi:hypothetical protein
MVGRAFLPSITEVGGRGVGARGGRGTGWREGGFAA